MNGLHPFYYYIPKRDLSNSLLGDPNEGCMKKLLSQQVDIPTYHFKVPKTIVVSYTRVIFRSHYILLHGVGIFHYYSPW